MTNKGQAIENANSAVKTQFSGLHNLLTLHYLNHKIACYEKEGSDPLRYYQCFDRIEQKAIRDNRALKEGVDIVADEFTICRWECQKKEGQLQKCLEKCSEGFKEGMVGLYADFYREKLEKQKRYKDLLSKQ